MNNQCVLCMQMEKETILEDAINQLKQLKERVKTLPKQVAYNAKVFKVLI